MTLLVFRNMGRFRNMPNSELGYSVIFIVGLILDIVCSASSLRRCICDCLYVCPYLSMSLSLSVCRYLSLYVSGCVCVSVYRPVSPVSVSVCLCLSLFLCLCVSACLDLRLFLSVSLLLFVCLCLSVCLCFTVAICVWLSVCVPV